ncbi:hypothetical protein M422DRAFT_240912, partial [Sphaerobolus stellatus SS14]
TSHSLADEDLDNIINDLYDEAEAEQPSDEDDVNNTDGISETLKPRGTSMVTVVTYCSSPTSVIETTHQSQQPAQQPSSPLEDMDANAPTGIRSRRPNQPLCFSSPLSDAPRTKIRKRKIIEVSESDNEEEEENIPPKKLSKMQQSQSKRTKTQQSQSRRRSTRLSKK